VRPITDPEQRFLSIELKTIASYPNDRAIVYALSGPNLRGAGIEHDLRRKHPYLDYDNYDFDVVIGSAGRLLRSLHGADRGDAAKASEPAAGDRQNFPADRSMSRTGKTCILRNRA